MPNNKLNQTAFMFYKRFLRPLLFRMDPEQAHNQVMKLAKAINNTDWMPDFINHFLKNDHYELPVHFRHLRFRNPVGLAAGFDKNGSIINSIYALGFGFTETGSITAQASAGNPRPRMFRLPEDDALINRMGLNNDGAEIITRRIATTKRNFPVGINISKTHDPAIAGNKAVEDYLHSFRLAEPAADYITINISCPNTREGKTFEEPEALTQLLAEIDRQRSDYQLPVLVKVSADVDESHLKTIADIALEYNMDGFVAVNTSTDRNGLNSNPQYLDKIGNGGLSGIPVYRKMLNKTELLRSHCGDKPLIISVGGINSAQKVLDCRNAGANLVQVYTSLVYEGPFLVHKMIRLMAQR